MHPRFKKVLRTAQVSFPFLLDAKFSAMRWYRKTRGIVFDRDFDGIRHFPVPDGAVFLDVGGNRGQSTDAILMIAPAARVEMFEPNPLLCKKIRARFANDRRLVIHECGLGHATGDFPLYVPFYKHWMFDGLASFNPEDARGWLNEDRVYFYQPEQITVQEVTCKVERLDDLNLVPFFIKLDVQGYEYQVLRGGERTLRTHEPVLLIESPPSTEIVAFLRDIGYELFTFRDNQFVPGVVESNNTFFMTERAVASVERSIRRAPIEAAVAAAAAVT